MTRKFLLLFTMNWYAPPVNWKDESFSDTECRFTPPTFMLEGFLLYRVVSLLRYACITGKRSTIVSALGVVCCNIVFSMRTVLGSFHAAEPRSKVPPGIIRL